MTNFQLFSGEKFNPKRFVFLKQGEREIHSLSENLSVTPEQTRGLLEDLRVGVELQEAARTREDQEVNELAGKLDTGLENEKVRTLFMSDLQQRLSVLLAMLVNDGEITEGSLAEGTINTTLLNLKKRDAELKLGADNQGRQLYNHEKKILELTQTLDGSKNADVTTAWNEVKKNLQNSVSLMRAAAEAISGSDKSFWQSEGVKKFSASAINYWNEMSPVAQGLAIAAGAVGSLWLLKRMFQGVTRGGESRAFGLLGFGALIAGGVYIAGKYMDFNEAMEKLRKGFANLDPTKLQQGLMAYFSGNLETAKKYWGEHYEAIVATLPGRRRGEGRETQPEGAQSTRTMEVRGRQVECVPAEKALHGYMTSMQRHVLPITACIETYKEPIAGLALYLGITNIAAVMNGLKFTVDSLLGFAGLLYRQGRDHPLRSLMILTAFLLARKATDPYLPKSPRDLGLYISGLSEPLKTFLDEHDLVGTQITADHVDLAAGVIAGERTALQRLTDASQDLGSNVANSLLEIVQQTPAEKIRQENHRGLFGLVWGIVSTLPDSPEKETFLLKIQELARKIRGGADLTAQDILELQPIALSAHVKITTSEKDHYVRWGIINDQGDYLDANDLIPLAINPSGTAEQQIEAASRFDPTSRNSILSTIPQAMRIPWEQARESLGNAGERLKDGLDSGDLKAFFMSGKWAIWEGAKHRFLDVPQAIVNGIQGDFTAKEFLFTWGAGVMPVLMLKSAKQIGKAALLWDFDEIRKIFKLGFVAESVEYPVRQIGNALSYGGNRIIKPFFSGTLRVGPLQGLRNVADATAGTFLEFFARIPRNVRYHLPFGAGMRDWSVAQKEALLTRLELDEAIDMARRGRDAARQGTRNTIFRSLRDFLGTCGIEIPGGVWAHDPEGALLKLKAAADGRMEIIRSAPLSDEAADIMRALSWMDEADETLRLEAEAARRAAALGGEVPEARAAAAGVEAIAEGARVERATAEVTAEALRRTTTISESLRAMRGGLETAAQQVIIREAASSGELGPLLKRIGFTDEAAALFVNTININGDATANITANYVENFTRRLQIVEALDALRAHEEISEAQRVVLRAAESADDITAVLRGSGAVESEVSALTRVLQNWGAPIDDALRRAGLIAEGPARLVRVQRAADAARAAARSAEAAEVAARATNEAVVSKTAATLSRAEDSLRALDNAILEARAAANAGELTPEMRAVAVSAANAAENSATLARESLAISRSTEGGAIATARHMAGQAEGMARTARTAAIAAAEGANDAEYIARVLAGIDADAPLGFAGETAQRSAAPAVETTAQVAEVAQGPTESISRQAMRDTLDILQARGNLELEQLGKLRVTVSTPEGAAELRRVLSEMGVATRDADTLITALQRERNLGRLADALEATGQLKVGQGVRGLLRIARFAPAGILIGAGAVGSGMEAYQAFAIARELRENSEARRILTDKGYLATIIGVSNLVVDVAGYAGAVTALPAFVIAAALMTVGFVVGSALEARAERAMTVDDYMSVAGVHGREELLHRLYTTGYDLGIGEIYDSATGSTREGYVEERTQTRRKIIEALLRFDSPNGHTTYYQYCLKYIEYIAPNFSINNFHEADKLIAQSKIFSEAMNDRSRVLIRPGTSPRIFVLLEQRYNIENITVSDVLGIFDAAKEKFANDAVNFLGEAQMSRLRSLDKNFVHHSINVLMTHLFSIMREAKSVSEENQRLGTLLGLLLTFYKNEGLNFVPDPTIENPTDELPNIQKIFFDENVSQTEIEAITMQYRPVSRGGAAFYELAKFYGYKGKANIVKLREFFNEEHAKMYGVYWDGEEWCANDKNGVDETFGANEDYAALCVLQEFKNDPSDVLEARFDYFNDVRARDDETKRVEQVRLTANLMLETFNGFEENNIRASLHEQEALIHNSRTAEERVVNKGISILAMSVELRRTLTRMSLQSDQFRELISLDESLIQNGFGVENITDNNTVIFENFYRDHAGKLKEALRILWAYSDMTPEARNNLHARLGDGNRRDLFTIGRVVKIHETFGQGTATDRDIAAESNLYLAHSPRLNQARERFHALIEEYRNSYTYNIHNPFTASGLDAFILRDMLEEINRCARTGFLSAYINGGTSGNQNDPINLCAQKYAQVASELTSAIRTIESSSLNQSPQLRTPIEIAIRASEKVDEFVGLYDQAVSFQDTFGNFQLPATLSSESEQTDVMRQLFG